MWLYKTLTKIKLMRSTDIIQGNTYNFDIVKESSGKKYYKVRTDDNMEFSIRKFKFQINQPLPDYIRCYVKSTYPITLRQDMASIISRFYTEGKEYNFTIKSVKFDYDQYFELEDSNGLCFKLYNAPSTLSQGNNVKCRILHINGVNISLKYVGKLSVALSLDFYDLPSWLNILGINPHYYNTFLNILKRIPQFHHSLSLHDIGDPSWILEILKSSTTMITDWLISCKDNLKSLSKISKLIQLEKEIALYILEGSDYLRNCNQDQRTLLQIRLSNHIELFEQHLEAAAKILNQNDESFIDNVFLHLKDAGYLYNPARQFKILMTILKLRPELINTRMGELFEALHNWDISNWKNEPFRTALVEQLQIFITENSTKINQLPANDTSDGNKIIVRIIIAIAVQRLLAIEADNIESNLNRSMLYRYISYLVPDNINILLNKSIEALLGLEIPNEFGWAETDCPTLLFLKSSHPSPNLEERKVVSKIYYSSKAELHLKSGSIQIIANKADEESTVIPNELFDWLSTKISLTEPIPSKNLRKSKDLKVFKQLWEDISWSIFGENQSDTREYTPKEKTEPYDGEEVKVIIDNVIFLNSGPERQRLQFHCTICDDIYKGDGWMICDTQNMIGWLSAKDRPGNYDGSLNFAHNRDGQPLMFTATVSKKNDVLSFSMKNQIDNFLLETATPDKDLIGIITHFDRINNVWLCLTELGSTFKIERDSSNDHLSEGKLVRVRYVEQDHSNTLTQFFIGELSPCQEDIPPVIRKSLCLYNLMQSFGEDPNSIESDAYEVREMEEVMTRDELLELISIYQRRAYTETEYLKAFNLLGFASILCKLAEEPTLLEELTMHMELLLLLHDFGKNQKISYSDLEKINPKICTVPMLERLFSRLKIVADLDTNKNSTWLWEVSKNPRNETEGKLASMVLAYNMLPQELEKTRHDIIKNITTLLNVNSLNRTSKYYGDESQTVEFKSSMIYSSRSGVHPDTNVQMHEILHIICGFMNARGGTLYIGVNDQGYECGLQDDLQYRLRRGQKATLDAMVVELQNNLDRKIPAHAKDHCEISIDPEAKKGVIQVNIRPTEYPVELDGIIYVRASSTTKPRLNEERTEFIKNRSHNYRILMNIVEQSIDSDNQDIESDNGNLSTDNSDEDIISTLEQPSTNNIDAKEIPDRTAKPLLSKCRQNILHYYEDNFVTPSYYLYFSDNCSFSRSEDDLYYDGDPRCSAAIVVKHQECDGVLIICYKDNHTSIIPMKTISELTTNEKQYLRADSSIHSINIGQQNDYLLSIIKQYHGHREIFYRIDKISEIPMSSNFSNTGELLCENDHEIILQEIISTDKINFFDPDAINREKRFYGLSIPNLNGTLSDEERIELLLKPLIPSD